MLFDDDDDDDDFPYLHINSVYKRDDYDNENYKDDKYDEDEELDYIDFENRKLIKIAREKQKKDIKELTEALRKRNRELAKKKH